MNRFGQSAPSAIGPRSLVVVLIGVAGLSLCLTLIFLGMRAVMDIGGACADGGPYVSRASCPEGVPLALVGGMFGLFAFGGLAAVGGAAIGGGYGAIVFLAWPALFLSPRLEFPVSAIRLRFGQISPGASSASPPCMKRVP